MNDFHSKERVFRKRSWKVPDSSSEDDDLEAKNVNESRGRLDWKRNSISIEENNDIRKYTKEDRKSILFELKPPVLQSRLDPLWCYKNRRWFTDTYFKLVKRRKPIINTSYPLTLNGSNNIQQVHMVNTRTMDMEFSSSSEYLAIASNCIRAGYISIIKSSSLLKDDVQTISPLFNISLTIPTQICHNEPLTSLHWLKQKDAVIYTRRACREISLFDPRHVTSSILAVLPYFVDHVISLFDTDSYIAALSDGQIIQIDCRMEGKYSCNWTSENPRKRQIGAIEYDSNRPNEILVSYKQPCTLDIIDIRSTRVSSISGNRNPVVTSSNPLPFLDRAYPISLHPFFTENEVVATLSDGSVTIIHKYTGETRLYSKLPHSDDNLKMDGIILRPFRPCFLTNSLYIPSIVTKSSCIPVFDFDSLICDNTSDRTAISPELRSISIGEIVCGCCYSSSLGKCVVSTGESTSEHQLFIYDI